MHLFDFLDAPSLHVLLVYSSIDHALMHYCMNELGCKLHIIRSCWKEDKKMCVLMALQAWICCVVHMSVQCHVCMYVPTVHACVCTNNLLCIFLWYSIDVVTRYISVHAWMNPSLLCIPTGEAPRYNSFPLMHAWSSDMIGTINFLYISHVIEYVYSLSYKQTQCGANY